MNRLVEVTFEGVGRNPSDYQMLARGMHKKLTDVAETIKKQVIIHINATAHGGGVAELLRGQIPLERSLGIDSHWLVIEADEDFFVVTKKIHNLLQGKVGTLSQKEEDLYFKTNNELTESLQKFLSRFTSGIVVIHDPQPLPLIHAISKIFLFLDCIS